MAFTDILNYKIIRLLGSGGMGSVYLAANVNIDQQVAIKVIRPEYAKNPAIRSRFKKEAELLCSLDHPGIVKFLNYIETESSLFLIMEYVKGTTLKDYIEKKNGLIVESKAWPILQEILDAFSYAHSNGIIHRDIKPSNIMITEDGHAKIMDFGIAGIVNDGNSGMEMAGGTPAYMSPEQVYGNSVDERSDIYSLGVLIFNMLSGKAPYDSTRLTDFTIKSKVVKEQLPRLKEFYPYVSENIQKVVDKATEKDPAKRYPDCKSLKNDIKKAIAPDKVPPVVKYGLIALGAIIILVGFLLWDFHRTKIEYYADYVEVFGVPKGIHRLSKREASHRNATYRFEKSKGKVRRVSYVNGYGSLMDQHDSESLDRIIDVTLTYAEGSDKLDTETFRDRSGRILYVKDFDTNLKTCTFKLSDEFGTEMTLNSQTELFESSFDAMLDGKSKISKYILHYDDDGHLLKMEYAGFGNIRVSDGQGIYGKSFKYDKQGRIIEESSLGKDGSMKSKQCGMAKKRFTYDAEDNLVRIEYLTADNKPSSDGNNCPVVKLDYDRWGNRISERYYTIDNEPILRKDYLTAGYIYEYDDHGNCVKTMNVGLDGNLTYSNGVAGCVMEYDDKGYVCTESYIDTKGKAAIFTGRDTPYFRAVFINDEHGNPLEMTMYNLENKPIESEFSPMFKRTYDAEGRMISNYFCDADGNITIAPALGYAGWTVEYNEQGRIRKMTLKDKDRKNFAAPDLHFCSTLRNYDARGNIISLSYLDENDKLTPNNEGITTVKIGYDDNGNEISRSFFDDDGKSVTAANYCALVEYGYDDQGNMTTTRYKDTNGKPMNVNGIAGHNREYDSRGRIINSYDVGLNGKILPTAKQVKFKYDDRDNLIERAVFNAAGAPTLEENGIHKTLNRYDGRNNLTRAETYGTDGHLKAATGIKAAIAVYEYDARNNNISQTYFDCDGNRGTDANGIHKYYNEYDKLVNKIQHQISFGVDGKPKVANDVSPEGRIEYDKRGNMTMLSCYDGYGKKINGNRGWSEKRFTYDESGQKTSEAYFSLDGKPVIDSKDGYYKCIYKYNPIRLIESMTFYGPTGKPMNSPQGFATVRYKYNNQNQQTEVSYWSIGGQPAEINGTYHKEIYHYRNGAPYKSDIYNKSNRKIATGTLVNNKWSYHMPGGGNRGKFGVHTDWISEWRQAAAACPIKFNDFITLRSISVHTDVIMMNFVVDEDSAMNVETTALMNVVREFNNSLRKELPIPSDVTIIVNIYDTSDKLLMSF